MPASRKTTTLSTKPTKKIDINGGAISPTELRKILGLDTDARLPTVRALATVLQESRHRSFELIAFRLTDGTYKTALVPRDQALKLSLLDSFLLTQGADLPRDHAQRSRLLKRAINRKPLTTLSCLPRLGWTQDKSCFALSNRIVGAAPPGGGGGGGGRGRPQADVQYARGRAPVPSDVPAPAAEAPAAPAAGTPENQPS